MRSLIALFLLTPALAGCLGGDAPSDPAATSEPDHAGTDSGTLVVGLADSGINPYHMAFRDPSPQAYQHPCIYIEGYPEHARALNLAFDAADYESAVAADEDVWASIEEGVLYWVPGTRIVGGIVAEPPLAGECPLPDCHGHGTFTASRAAGEDLSLCPTCKVAMAQGFEAAFEWLADTAWVDVNVGKFIDTDGFHLPRSDNEARAKSKPTFFPSGNGVPNPGRGFLGGAGAPSTMWNRPGLPSVITVGGHHNGNVAVWPGSVPHVVADICPMGADWTSFEGTYTRFGTSHSTPYVAGAASELVAHARGLLGGGPARDEPGVVARGDAGSLEEGSLADGEFTVAELRQLLLATADPRPEPTIHDGDTCPPTHREGRFGTSPIAWQMIPEDAPQYYFVGYGAVNEDTLEHANRVLRGEEPMPERPVEDAFFTLDQEVRQALVEVGP